MSLHKRIANNRKSNGILAVELGFAPPKSVSLAALAGVSVSREIIVAHRAAVDDTLAFFSRLLVAREKGRLVGCGVQLMEFLHPWTRARDPQLHSHILLLRDENFSHALWTTPLFLIQKAMREVYHYSLCGRLLRAGHAVLIDEPGSLAWELSGVPAEDIEKFSKRSRMIKELAMQSPRGFFSQGAEFRVAGWISRRLMPKTDTSVSLADARKKNWGCSFPPIQLGGAIPRVETAGLDLAHVFRLSAVITREQFIASHLRWWLGSRKTLAEATAIAEEILRQHLVGCRILQSGRAYCLPEAFGVEEMILGAVTSGFNQGSGLVLQQNNSMPPTVKRLLGAPHAVKVISTYGEEPPSAEDLFDRQEQRFSGRIRNLDFWNSATVLRLIKTRNNQELVIFVQEPLWLGSFGTRVARVLSAGRNPITAPNQVFRVRGRNLAVSQHSSLRPGEAPSRVLKLWSGLMQKLGPLLRTKTKKLGGVLLAPNLPADQIGELNWRILEEATASGGRPVKLLRRVSWQEFVTGKLQGLGVFAARRAVNAPQIIRQGEFWRFAGPATGGQIKVVGIKRSKSIPLEELRAAIAGKDPHLALVEPIEAPLIPGIPLMSPLRFECGHQVFRRGEVQVLTRIGRDGRLHFGEKFWPGEQILLEPAFVVREFIKNQPHLPALAMHVDACRHLQRVIEGLPRAGVTILLSQDPETVCRKLEQDFKNQGEARMRDVNRRAFCSEWMDDLALLFPQAKGWRELGRDRVLAFGSEPTRGDAGGGVSQKAAGQTRLSSGPEPLEEHPLLPRAGAPSQLQSPAKDKAGEKQPIAGPGDPEFPEPRPLPPAASATKKPAKKPVNPKPVAESGNPEMD